MMKPLSIQALEQQPELTTTVFTLASMARQLNRYAPGVIDLQIAPDILSVIQSADILEVIGQMSDTNYHLYLVQSDDQLSYVLVPSHRRCVCL